METIRGELHTQRGGGPRGVRHGEQQPGSELSRPFSTLSKGKTPKVAREEKCQGAAPVFGCSSANLVVPRMLLCYLNAATPLFPFYLSL